ncbi:hypothetical protein MK535_06960 [Streptococcus anginosus]|uniref:hypothetical protein n=1 Tax=Streptococcus anginosus TaxID=1328 RepID=UPI0022844668|nr:hypothetical protein [Streptococcus anginosus]MCY7233100.1 hypothetical protein [Streptococcus anginosus]
MSTTIIGFPRLGEFRELKFTTEKYFRNEISAQELLAAAKDLRAKHWNIVKEHGITEVPSNDFSHYDNVLDAAFLFNVVPSSVQGLDLSDLERYFALARGYQGEKGDVRALPMKKWFNTNYHYIVPKFEKDTEVKLVGHKIFDEYQEAKELGLDTRPVLVGPFTLLQLSDFEEGVEPAQFVATLAKAYQEVFATLADLGAGRIQLDEPSLVKDLSAEVLDLEATGVKIIQIDEAALREKLPLRRSDWYEDYLDWAIPAFRLVHSTVAPDTQIHTHMCYSEFTDIIPAIDNMDADVISFKASRSNLEILDELKAKNFQTEVGPGVYDIHSPRVPNEGEIDHTIEAILAKVPSRKVWINPDCGLKTRGITETKAAREKL